MSEQSRRHGAARSEPVTHGSRADRQELEAELDEASEASFPASDPPAWMSMRIGGPSSRGEARPARRRDGASMREPEGG
jgi:hypothetical protein